MKKSLALLAGTALMAISGASYAGLSLDTSQVVGTAPLLPTSRPITGFNDLGFTGSVFYGQMASTPGFIAFEYLGKEADYTNNAIVMGTDVIISTGTTAPGTMSSWYAVGNGLIDLTLCTSGGLSVPMFGGCIANTNATSIIDQYNFTGVGVGYRSLGFRQEEGGTWLMFWDDSGANNDDDYDDLVARIHFTVPEPATLGMLGLGLLGLGFAGRRRRS